MKKITLLFFAMLAFTWQANAQVLNEGFEAGIPADWTQEYVSASIDWVTAAGNGDFSITPRTGAAMAQFITSNFGDATRLVTPALDLTTLTTPELTFYYANVNWFGDVDELRVYYKNSAAGTWTQIGATYEDEQTAWTEVKLILPNPSADYYIAFEATSEWARGMDLDDILVDEAPTCPQPGTLTASPISITDADISWIAGNSETSWNYEYGPTGFAMGAGTPGTVTAQTLSLSGLTNGDYDIYVQADCGSGDVSTWVGPATWTQPSNAGDICALPIVATLEANCATATPNTIDYAVANADLSAISCAAAGSNGAWFEITTSDSGAVRIYSTGDMTGMVVFTDCGSELYCNSLLAPDFSLTGFLPNTTYLIALWKEAATTGTSTVCFEDIACNFVTDFTVANITETTAEIGWTENGSATTWDIEYGETGFTPTEIPTLNDVTNPYTVTGLTASTTYDFYVRADCGMDDTDVSIYNGPYTFTTLAPAPANDNLADAIAINCGDTVLGNTTSATLDEDDAPDGVSTDTDSPNVWYSFIGTGDDVFLDTCNTGTNFDTEILVFTGASGALTLIADGYDECGSAGGWAAQTEFTSVAGTQYWISIEGFNATSIGDFELTVTCTPLSIEDYENGLSFNYYPNPVNNTLALKAQKDIENVSVYNMLGQEVLRTAPNAVNTEVNMSALQTGAYFVKVTIGNATETVKVIKN
jgi:hypothetical protein